MKINVIVTQELIELPEGAEEPTLEQVVDADIDAFAKYFCTELGNDPLAKAERSIIKTYLRWKTYKEYPSGEA